MTGYTGSRFEESHVLLFSQYCHFKIVNITVATSARAGKNMAPLRGPKTGIVEGLFDCVVYCDRLVETLASHRVKFRLNSFWNEGALKLSKVVQKTLKFSTAFY